MLYKNNMFIAGILHGYTLASNCLPRPIFITLKVARENRSKYKITCQSVTMQYASNTHIIFVQNALKNIDIKNNKFLYVFSRFHLFLYLFNFIYL